MYTPVIQRYGLGGSPAVLDALHAQYEQARASHPGVADGEPLTSTQNARVLGYRIPTYAATGPVTVHLLMSGDGPAGSVLVDLPVTVEWVGGVEGAGAARRQLPWHAGQNDSRLHPVLTPAPRAALGEAAFRFPTWMALRDGVLPRRSIAKEAR